MKINWKVRVKSPQFWIGLVGVIASPILAYLGLGFEDLTTWSSIGEVFAAFFSNPYLIGTVVMAVLSFIGVLTDPTTKGMGDSEQALTYEKPKESGDEQRGIRGAAGAGGVYGGIAGRDPGVRSIDQFPLAAAGEKGREAQQPGGADAGGGGSGQEQYTPH